jgi:thymidylate synthase (FAD)
LDNGYVSLIDVMGDDADICQAARVSYGKGTKSISDDRNLIRYLLRHKHTTPFEMVVFKFHIAMPIHAHRQFIRHRMSTTNEYSARYSVVPEVMYDEYNLNLQSKNNKQGRNDLTLENDYEGKLKDKILTNENQAFSLYNELVEAGVAREVARMHLPLNTYTYFYWKVDLHNLLHFLKLRCDSHAQYEIRQYSNALASLVKVCCPAAFEAWEDYSFYASNFTRLDKQFLNFVRLKEADGNEATPESPDLLRKAEEIGMSKREVTEFFDKLSTPEPICFDLDLSKAKDASFYGSN